MKPMARLRADLTGEHDEEIGRKLGRTAEQLQQIRRDAVRDAREHLAVEGLNLRMSDLEMWEAMTNLDVVRVEAEWILASTLRAILKEHERS